MRWGGAPEGVYCCAGIIHSCATHSPRGVSKEEGTKWKCCWLHDPRPDARQHQQQQQQRAESRWPSSQSLLPPSSPPPPIDEVASGKETPFPRSFTNRLLFTRLLATGFLAGRKVPKEEKRGWQLPAGWRPQTRRLPPHPLPMVINYVNHGGLGVRTRGERNGSEWNRIEKRLSRTV